MKERMPRSKCCGVRAIAAKTAERWYWDSPEGTTNWYECSQCKQPCDTLSEAEYETTDFDHNKDVSNDR